jgi:pimeloyl-ACP methyl ester carboxylesterase
MAPPSSRSSINFAETSAVTALDCAGAARAIRLPDGYAIPDLADDVTEFCRTVGIERPIVVGHSLGGMIAVELAGRRPSLPRALVLVDPGPIDWDPEMCRRFDTFAEQLAGPDGEEIRRRYVENMGACDPALALSIADMMSAIPLPIATP